MRNAVALGVVCCALVAGGLSSASEQARAQEPVAKNAVVTLDHGWQFRQVAAAQPAEDGWLPATVPGDVHLDLLANKKIQTRFTGTTKPSCSGLRKKTGSTG